MGNRLSERGYWLLCKEEKVALWACSKIGGFGKGARRILSCSSLCLGVCRR